jgi:hypothetical protein
MIHKENLLISVAAALVIVSSGYAEPSAFETVTSAPQFAIGGVGEAGVMTSTEVAMRKLRDGPRAEEQLRKLLREATPEGKMYALFALRQLNSRDYHALSEPYRHSSVVITREDGCIIHQQATSDTVEWIDEWAIKSKSWEKKRPNQSMKPTAPDRMIANVFATGPARGLSLSR